MRLKLILAASFALSLGLGGCSSVPTGALEGPPVTLGCSSRSLAQGNEYRLSFIWAEGRHYIDEDLWCNQGEKYKGRFLFRVSFADGHSVDTPCETVNVPFDSIHARETLPWEITIQDYNNDGQGDFCIDFYGGCNWVGFSLFTILPSGKVELLKIEGHDELFSNHGFDSSMLQLTPKGFYHEVYDREANEEVWQFLEWDKERKLFQVREQKIKLRQ